MNEQLKVIAERIKKLLALAGSSNEHEAYLASQKALELQNQYNIDISLLEEKDIDIGETETELGGRVPMEWSYLLSLLQEYYHVEVIYRKGYRTTSYVLIGEKGNIQIANYVLAYLKREIDNNYKKFLKQHKAENEVKGRNLRASYAAGFYKGIREVLNSTKKETISTAQERGLVVIDKKVSEYLKQKYPHLTRRAVQRRAYNSSAYSAGVTQGQNTTLNAGINGSSTGGQSLRLGL